MQLYGSAHSGAVFTSAGLPSIDGRCRSLLPGNGPSPAPPAFAQLFPAAIPPAMPVMGRFVILWHKTLFRPRSTSQFSGTSSRLARGCVRLANATRRQVCSRRQFAGTQQSLTRHDSLTYNVLKVTGLLPGGTSTFFCDFVCFHCPICSVCFLMLIRIIDKVQYI